MGVNRFDEEAATSRESGTSTSAVSRTNIKNTAVLPEPGDLIGSKYRLGRVLGSGAMGVVYEATHVRLRQRLAIKILRPNLPNFEQLVARFETEAHATARLRSIHAARIIDVDTLPDGLPYIVMEYLEGRTLDAELEAVGPMPVDVATDIVVQVADAMTEAHGLGIVHRDLKPANLFICRVGDRLVVKVLDFGISKVDGGDARITGSDEWFGTPCYAAPEQLRSCGDVDPRGDIWSLGVILFELLTNRTPFLGSSMEVIAKVLTEPVPWPLEFRPDLPRELARVIMKALERDRTKRHQTMSEMVLALAPFGPAQSASSVLTELQRSRGRLGEILVADGLVAQADLERALEAQRRDGRLLGRILLDMNLVGHADLLAAIAKQQGLPSRPLEEDPTERARRAREAETLAPPAKPMVHRPASSRWAWMIATACVVLVLVGVAVALTRSTSRRQAVERPAPSESPQ
jgi:Protein kinase domain